MPQLIHLTDKRRLAMIRRNGITARAVHGRGKGVFATPVTRNYFLSYQWLRELRRSGIRTVSAVQFRVDDDEEVMIGRYNEEPVTTTAADAVRLFIEHKTGLGLEITIPRAVPSKSITRIHTPRQITGWRYYPESHSDGRRPCGCRYCQRGQIRNRRLRTAYEAWFNAS